MRFSCGDTALYVHRRVARWYKTLAAITDEPPTDVAAAGHHRCIINLRPEHIDAWLAPEGRTPQELQNILSDHAVSTFDIPPTLCRAAAADAARAGIPTEL